MSLAREGVWRCPDGFQFGTMGYNAKLKRSFTYASCPRPLHRKPQKEECKKCSLNPRNHTKEQIKTPQILMVETAHA